MKIVQVIAVLGVIAMSAALINGFVRGNFFEDGSQLLSNPWGVVSLIDLYVGFVIFSIWIVYRESSLVSMIIWVVLMMVLGFFTASVYVLYASVTSNNDVLKFVHGHRAKNYIKKG